MNILILLLSCTNDPAPSSKPTESKADPRLHNPNRKKGPHPPNRGVKPGMKAKGPGFLPSSTPAEDLSGSWNDALAQQFTPPPAQSDCPDQDGDGFVSALLCPGNPPSTLDCDDQNPAVTPQTEIWIPPGPFLMGSQSSHAGSDEKPVHTVKLSGYCLDRLEVRSQDWFRWLQETKREPSGSDVRNIKEGKLESNRGDYPAEGVTWAEAYEYCIAQGKTLPTEAQWEKAARGGCELGKESNRCDPADLRPYPWGTAAPTCALANHQLSTTGMPKLCVSDTQKVDSLPDGAGPYGHLHLSGNVWEYVLDVWHPKVYTNGRIDPSGPESGTFHVLRGGGWNTFSTNMRAANRFHDLVMGSATGFRCARTPTSSTPDPVPPLTMVTISGTVRSNQGLNGRALYITAFDAADADANGMLAPGRSPISEQKLTPNQKKAQTFSLSVPQNGSYILSAALDAGTGANKDDYISASGSGGFGQAKQNPISAPSSVSDIDITIMSGPQR
ncbi:MAG: SUMF1/EgtB/PvdO family nonheme iron enzyme [Myxococcota bacterium]|nr:SUMF1/EgtB/PvdO family nonheme iron enzyme [Myxococcota bacterium]